MQKPIFIDTDTASDDAVALMMAFAHRGHDIVGIGVVAGNCPVEQAVQNALYIAEICEIEVPVYQGCHKPLIRPLETAQHVHGVDGMGDIGLPLYGRKPAQGHAVQALIQAADESDGDLDLITLGPLTNIATALIMRPDMATKIRRCVMMGGTSDSYGNITPVSEYNIWADPEAAEIVFSSGLLITMVGWDISRKYAEIDDGLARKLRSIGTKKAYVAIDSQSTLEDFCKNVTGVKGFDLPDPIAVAIALDPQIAVAGYSAAVSVSMGSGLTRGQTIIDDRGMTDRKASVTVVTEASREKFLTLLTASLGDRA